MQGAKFLAGVFIAVLPTLAAAQDMPPKMDVRASVVASGGAQEKPDQSEVSLDWLVQEALARNPSIQAAQRRVEAMRARIPQARALPDPKLSVGWMGNIAPFDVQEGDPSSYRSIAAMQELPYPGKLKLRGEIAGREAEAVWWEYEATRRQVEASVKAAYYEYFYAHKATEITRRNKDLLERLAQIADARYRVGKAAQQDVLRAQVEISRILQRLTLLEQQQRTAQARLNTLLFRSADSPLSDPAEPRPAELKATLESLQQFARENDTGIQGERRQIERSQKAVDLARREYLPDLSVGYMYQNRPRMPEMHGFSVTLNIPVFYRSKQRQGINEATQELLGAQRKLEDRETSLQYEVKELYLAAKASEELARLFSQAIVPQSSLTLDSSLAAYEVGAVDFLTVLNNFVTVLDYQMGYYRELANQQVALARLEPLVGVKLTP